MVMLSKIPKSHFLLLLKKKKKKNKVKNKKTV